MIPLPAFISPRLLLMAGAALVILIGLWAWGEKRESDGRAEVQAAWDDERATLMNAAADAERKQRATEQEFARMAQEAAHAHAKERQRNARAVADIAGDRDRLRIQLEAYAAGDGGAPGNPGPAASERTAKLGRALDEALSAHAACVGTAADLAADVRALRAAWPTEVKEPQ